ncbi:MAG: hypothetical protein K2K94_02470 [Muribaculaceae bacterium]|nr:hypothetical protein [Muribaculaceae bacterium]
MKKFYTSALAALCVLGVSAGINGAQLRSDVVMKTAPQSALKLNKSMGLSFEKAAPDKVMSRAEEEVNSIEGDYNIYIGDYYFETSQGALVEEAFITLDENGNVVIECDFFPSLVAAGYDEATGTLSFSQIKFGQVDLGGQQFYVRFEPFAYVVGDDNKGNIVSTNFEATFDATTGEIAFPADHGFSWVAYSDSKYKMKAGYLGLYDIEGMEPYKEIDYNEGWTTVGTATLEDAWITPAYNWEDGEGISPAEAPIIAELQQNDEVETLYRLVNPYYDPNWLLIDTNMSTKTGYIVFDIADPDYVVVKAGYPAGYKNEQGEFYVFGMLGWQINSFGSDWDDSLLPQVIAFMEEKGQPFDTYADDVVTVNKSVFDISPKCSKAYSWTDVEYVVSTITMDIDSDVNGIAVVEANDNAPVEYFNLQGVRVDNPAAGQVVIKRQGAKATKTIVR